MGGQQREATGARQSSGETGEVDRLRALIDRTRPVSLAEQRLLPVLAEMEPLLSPDGRSGAPVGLRRGSVVGLAGHSGATALALALAAGPTRSGSWAAFVGLPELGWAAAAEMGVDLARCVAVRPTAAQRTSVVAALLDAFDVVLCGFHDALSATEARRLTARVRERSSVLVVVGGLTGGAGPVRRAWPGGADAELTVIGSEWIGLEEGAGHLRERRVTVEVGGRRGMDRLRRVELVLPGSRGAPRGVPADSTDSTGATDATGATVTPLRRVG
jgi:hypothetical protein